MNKTLQNKIKAYSALTAVAVIGGPSAHAGIIHSNVNYTGGYETYDIDIDGNGVVDFTMTQESLWSSIGTVNRQYINGNGSNSFIGSSSNGMFSGPGATALNSGYTIDSSASFMSNKTLTWGSAYGGTMGVYYNVYSGSLIGNGGEFGGGVNGKFVGISFDVSGNTHYGWLRFNTNSTNDSWTLVDMAYDCLPGTAITTGVTSGGMDVVPNSGSLSNIESCTEITSLTAPTATDGCGNTLTGTTTTSLPISTSTTITWTYNDGMGNTSTQNQNIIITIVDATLSIVGNTIGSNETDASATYQWVDCDNSNAPIGGETSIDFTPTISGNYAVEVTVNNCMVMSACITLNFVGVHENSVSNVTVFPNPAKDKIVINLNQYDANTSIEVVDLTGKIVATTAVNSKSVTLDVSEFSKGIYLAKVISSEGAFAVKFIKE